MLVYVHVIRLFHCDTYSVDSKSHYLFYSYAFNKCLSKGNIKYMYPDQVKTKTVRQCVQFYYLWKKVLVDDHKRLRVYRRRREQDYNLRSTRAQGDAATNTGSSHQVGA